MNNFFKQRSLPYFIIGSLVLLTTLEVLWLRRAFENERTELRSIVFQSLRTALSDENSFQILQEIRKNPVLDSLVKSGKISNPINFGRKRADFVKVSPPIDSIADNTIQTAVSIVMDAHGRDSLGKSPIVVRFSDSNMLSKTKFKLRVLEKDQLTGKTKSRAFFDDTMSVKSFSFTESIFNDSIDHHADEDSVVIKRLRERLQQDFQSRKNLHLPFDVSILNREEVISPQRSAIIASVPLRDGSHRRKVAVAMYEADAFLLRKITPEILLSLFVLAVISFSFWLVYRSFQQQKQLTELKNDLISNITHELKTPIATVSVALEALQNFDALKNPQLTTEYLDISRHELSRLSMLVDKVLKLSVFEQKEPELNREILNLSQLVQRVVDSMRLQLQKSNATVNLDLGDPSVTNLTADPTHLTSVIYNLLDNALKYGGKQITMKITPLSTDLQFSISDDGKGISADYQDKIFDKFFRVPTGDVHNTKGHGLGLSYVLSVVNLHGGTIFVDSTEGMGSTFTLTLPR